MALFSATHLSDVWRSQLTSVRFLIASETTRDTICLCVFYVWINIQYLKLEKLYQWWCSTHTYIVNWGIADIYTIERKKLQAKSEVLYKLTIIIDLKMGLFSPERRARFLIMKQNRINRWHDMYSIHVFASGDKFYLVLV